jgi:hypothetical protein
MQKSQNVPKQEMTKAEAANVAKLQKQLKAINKPLTKSDRKKLLKKPLIESDIKALFAKGLSIWEVTEAYYGRTFDHRRSARKMTWIFYQKINNVKHKLGLKKSQVNIAPLTKVAISTFLQKHTEAELRALLVRTNK